jgi:hypothetical protein
VTPVSAERHALGWLRALREPELALGWTLAQWEARIRTARRLRLLGRLAEAVEGAGLTPRVPEVAALHLVDERKLSRWRTQALRWAMQRVGADLAGCSFPRVLLKGAAYVAQSLPNAGGRLPSDLDILVPRSDLATAQARLVAAGWEETPLDEHDRRYYHEWSHEIPPMRHPMVELELDLHHNIHPPVSRTKVDANRLFERAEPVRSAAWHGWQVLHPQDQLLHCASHLFEDSEFRNRLRDLVDFDALARAFGNTPTFWDGLPERARVLGLHEDFALAVDLCCDWFDTPVPPAVRSALDSAVRSPLHRLTRALMARALWPAPVDAEAGPVTRLADAILLVRHHLRRMPLRLLLPHLMHKWRKGHALVNRTSG